MAQRVESVGTLGNESPPSPEELRHAVVAIRSSREFAHSERLGHFLEYIIERKLGGEQTGAKEYDLALDIFHRKPSFDPAVDSVVRVEARRLRAKLARYYADQGRSDGIVISLPRGAYMPEFERRPSRSRGLPGHGRRRGPAVGVLVAVLALASGYLLWSKSRHAAPYNAEAQGLYAQARYLAQKRTLDALEQSIALYQRTVALEPRYAEAYAGMASDYVVLCSQRELPDPARLDRARAAIGKALALKPNIAEAHASLGLIHFLYDWDFAAARMEYERALVLDPSNARVHHWYSEVLFAYGLEGEGLAEVRRAHALDPVSVGVNSYNGWILYTQHRYDEAIVEFRKALELDSYWKVHRNLGWAYDRKGWHEQAVAEQRVAVKQSGDLPEALSSLAVALARSGRRAEAQAILTRLKAATPPLSPCEIAAVQIALGQLDAAIDNLEWAYHERSTYLLTVAADPRYDEVRSSPRVEEIFRGMGIPIAQIPHGSTH